ncbi:MAG: arsenate reductase ArsC [Planctomycetes bacterium]|nr:arsenate reductase ArsC [Planctomycetota bacterium]
MTAIRLLFVCIENSNRSQMAEAFARIHARTLCLEVEAHSAGSRPSGVVHPKAIAAMAELGYDLAVHRSKALKEVETLDFDVVVTMGCGDACPWVKARRRVDWQIPDPKQLAPADFAKVRDLVGGKVLGLLEEIN